MRIHVIRHVPFEGPGAIAEWASERGHSVTEAMAMSEGAPFLGDIDFLVVMGGPMDADDEIASPWLAPEKRFIGEAIAAGKLVLGVCLGAQIIAEVAGGRVKRARQPEIGWYPVRRTEASERDPLFAVFPEVLVAGHWHGDTFDLPPGVQPVLSSDATANQAFTFNQGRVVGLQFHLEWTREGLEELVDACIDELVDGAPYLTTAADMIGGADRHLPACHTALYLLLDLMESLDAMSRPQAGATEGSR